MSGAQTSTFADPNILYKTLSGAGYQEVEQNRLMNQGRERGLAADDMEMIARGAGSLLLLPDEASRAAAYPDTVARLQQYGVKAGLPSEYPGEAALRRAQAMGTPSAELFKLGVDRAAKGAIAPGDGGTTATGTGGGGGTGGADTAPINAAGDSRTRKAGEGGPPAAGSPGAAVAQRTHDFWLSKGYSEEQVAGIMAGGPGSESNFTPTVYGDNGTSYGQYQHHGPRLDAMRQFFGLSGSQMPSEDQQNQYAHWEITQGPLKNVGEMLKAAKTPAEAAAIWTQYFGVPADKSEIGRRAAGAQRFVGLYGQPQQGGPGGATASAAPPGVQMGGAPPPPPGGAPGAYPVQGAGFGAVVGQGVRPNVGGPQLTVAPPPVIQAQPIPSGRFTSNADVIMGGVRQAQATPLAGTQVAGPPMVASTQPTAAVPAPPVETPTPARYAGTAPAPSVEAPPETGWGSQVGSGYGPQNTLAPAPVPPAPARPATPAAAATATQPPAADTLPPLPAPTPPERRNNNGLTAAQQHDIDTLRGTSITSEHLQARVDAYRTANDARAEKYQQDQIAYVREARERQTAAGTAAHQAREEQRQADELKLRAEKAARERQKAADPIQGTDDKSNADRTLFRLVDKMNAGTATPEERRLYAQAAQYYLKPQMQWISDPDEPTKSIMVPVAGQLPYGFPHPSFQPGQPTTETKPPVPTKTDFKPLPDSERKLLVDTSTRLDQLAEQRSTFKPDFGGFGSAALGEAANLAARNLPGSPTAVARADWWQNYQRMKLAVRQGISGQSLTASELAEFDKADINPGMSADRIAANLAHQDRVLRTSHERRVRSLAADRYSPDAIREAGGIDPTTAAEHPAGESAPTPPASPPPPGFKVIVP